MITGPGLTSGERARCWRQGAGAWRRVGTRRSGSATAHSAQDRELVCETTAFGDFMQPAASQRATVPLDGQIPSSYPVRPARGLQARVAQAPPRNVSSASTAPRGRSRPGRTIAARWRCTIVHTVSSHRAPPAGTWPQAHGSSGAALAYPAGPVVSRSTSSRVCIRTKWIGLPPVQLLEQHPHGLRTDLSHRLAQRREARSQQTGHRGVVPSRHGHLPRNAEASVLQRLDGTGRHEVVGAHQRRGTGPAQQLARRGVPFPFS